jgi:hypothetical protein
LLVVTEQQRREANPNPAPFSVRALEARGRGLPGYVVWNQKYSCAATEAIAERARAFRFMDRLNRAAGWRAER